MGALTEAGSSILLFALVFGMSATVECENLRKQLRNKNALLTGIFLQFVILPFLGFAVVKALGMSSPMGITLLVVTSSPGGSYSNWWCSMFNADLALSVTMTAISTFMSIFLLPVNLVIYATSSYSGAVVKSLDWIALFVSLIVVISAILLGLYCSYTVKSHKFNLLANKMGNLAGVLLVVFSAWISSSGQDAQIWGRDWKFYLGVAAPCVLGLVFANMITSFFNLALPERVSVSVECCYQNVGIATSVAITMFDGDELAEAVGVPLYYGMVEAVVLGIYCIGAWKSGWTKAPKNERFCVVIATSYEVEDAELNDPNAIEVVLGLPKENGLPEDLIFYQDETDGYTIDSRSLESASNLGTPDRSGKSATLPPLKEEAKRASDEMLSIEIEEVTSAIPPPSLRSQSSIMSSYTSLPNTTPINDLVASLNGHVSANQSSPITLRDTPEISSSEDRQSQDTTGIATTEMLEEVHPEDKLKSIKSDKADESTQHVCNAELVESSEERVDTFNTPQMKNTRMGEYATLPTGSPTRELIFPDDEGKPEQTKMPITASNQTEIYPNDNLGRENVSSNEKSQMANSDEVPLCTSQKEEIIANPLQERIIEPKVPLSSKKAITCESGEEFDTFDDESFREGTKSTKNTPDDILPPVSSNLVEESKMKPKVHLSSLHLSMKSKEYQKAITCESDEESDTFDNESFREGTKSTKKTPDDILPSVSSHLGEEPKIFDVQLHSEDETTGTEKQSVD